MTPDDFEDFTPRPRRRDGSGRRVLFAGVAGACVLGVGLGLWARPATSERQMAIAAPTLAPASKAAAPSRRIQIVVDDGPAPIGAPIEVLAHTQARSPTTAVPVLPLVAEALAPVRAPQGLMRIQSVTAPAPAASGQRAPKAKPAPAPRAAAPKLVVAHAKPAPARPAVLPPPPVHFAKAAPAKPSPKLVLARAEQARAEAKAAKAKARAELARAAKAARHEQLRLAQAEARGRAEARAEAKAEALAEAQADARKRARLASLAHALARAMPHRAKAEPPVQLARLDRKPAHKVRRDLKTQQVSARKAPRATEPPYRTRAVPTAAAPHPGLMKVSTAPRCANRDSGAARVCADPALGAAERQLLRAYQGARAAGVSDAQLQRQQQRWLAARSAAAREAPWAVHDVYIARIAELNGMARDARGDGY